MSSVCVFFPSVLSPVCFYTFSIYLSFCFYLLLLPLQSSVSFHSYFPYSFLFCSFFSCICNDLHTRFFSPSSVICHQHFKENRHKLCPGKADRVTSSLAGPPCTISYLLQTTRPVGKQEGGKRPLMIWWMVGHHRLKLSSHKNSRQTNGNICVYKSRQTPVWFTMTCTASSSFPHLLLQQAWSPVEQPEQTWSRTTSCDLYSCWWTQTCLKKKESY